MGPEAAFPAGVGPLPYMGSTAPSGWVMADGRTIGNAASAATNRANADTVALFTVLWDSLSNTVAPVSGGRGASAAADYAANKTLTLPDCRGRVAAFKDDMGGTAASRLTSGGSGVAGNTLGASGGAETHSLTAGQLPNTVIGTGGSSIQRGSGTTDLQVVGSNQAHNNTQPTIITNAILKL